jgi:TATA-box binding protein (TBP) (component of TFIID and TFIIIB)
MKRACPTGDISSFPKLITITLVANAKCTIDTDAFKLRMKDIEIRPKGKNVPPVKWSLKHTEFYNQVTMSCTDQMSTKSVKIFSNGSIQIAGCADLFDCHRVIQQIAMIIHKVMDIKVDIDTFRICMINANFQFNRYVNLRECTRHFSSNPMFKTTFSEDKYAAVKIKFSPGPNMKSLTASIFGTGKVILSGAETLKEIAFSYNMLVQYINQSDTVLEHSQTDVGSFSSVMGYEIPDWVDNLSKRNFKSWEFTYKNNQISFLSK